MKVICLLALLLPFVLSAQLVPAQEQSQLPDSTDLPVDSVIELHFGIRIDDCAHGHLCCDVGCACCPEGRPSLIIRQASDLTRTQARKMRRQERRPTRSSRPSSGKKR